MLETALYIQNVKNSQYKESSWAFFQQLKICINKIRFI